MIFASSSLNFQIFGKCQVRKLMYWLLRVSFENNSHFKWSYFLQLFCSIGVVQFMAFIFYPMWGQIKLIQHNLCIHTLKKLCYEPGKDSRIMENKGSIFLLWEILSTVMPLLSCVVFLI